MKLGLVHLLLLMSFNQSLLANNDKGKQIDFPWDFDILTKVSRFSLFKPHDF